MLDIADTAGRIMWRPRVGAPDAWPQLMELAMTTQGVRSDSAQDKEIISRAEAKARGLKRYFTGKPCPNGHLTYRYTKSGCCPKCKNIARSKRTAVRKIIHEKIELFVNENSPLITRRAAMERGLKRYFTGKPCKWGHISERQTSGYGCVQCTRESKKAKSRQSELAKIDHEALSSEGLELIGRAEARANGLVHFVTGIRCRNGHVSERYVLDGKCVACVRGRVQKHKRENRDLYNAIERAGTKRNPEAKRLRSLRYADKNRKKLAERRKAWDQKNPDKKRSYTRNRRAKIREIEGYHTGEDVQRIIKMQQGKCAYCREPLNGKYDVDHIVPLKRGGTNWPSNIQATCHTCNVRKNARDPIDFARDIGLLL